MPSISFIVILVSFKIWLDIKFETVYIPHNTNEINLSFFGLVGVLTGESD